MKSWCLLFYLLLTLTSVVPLAAQTTPWVTAYYAGWQQAFDTLQAQDIDYGAVTHIAHFAIGPDWGGELEIPDNMTAAFAQDLTTRAHAEGVKVLITVGGADTRERFRDATISNLSHFIDNLINFMSARNYDGIDIDWEPLTSDDVTPYVNLINGLRARPTFAGKLLTAATGWNGNTVANMFFNLRNSLDQINLMTYGLSGPFPRWLSWHSSAIFQDIMPWLNISVDSVLSKHLQHNLPPAKLGTGIGFYGNKWVGGVRQATPVQNDGIHTPRVASYFFDCWANDCWGTFTTQVFANQFNWVTVSPGLIRTRDGVTMSIIRGRNIEVDPTGGANQEWITVLDVDAPNNRIYAWFSKNHIPNTPIGVEINAVLQGDPYPWKGNQMYPDRAYSVIMDQDYPIATFVFDNAAKVPWLGYNLGGHENHFFVSYDNQQSIGEKWNYAINQRALGGQIVFELGGGYRRSFTGGLKDSLLQAVKIPLITRFAEQNKSASSAATAFNSARHLAKSGSYLHEVFTSGGEIFYRRSQDGGETWDQTHLLSPELKGNSAPSIAVAGDGSVQVVWQRKDPLNPTPTYTVWHRRSTDDGVSWENAVALAADVSVSSYQTNGVMPVIEYAMEQSGGLLLAIFCSEQGLRYRISPNNGVTWQVPNPDIIPGKYNNRVESPSLAGSDSYFSLVYDYVDEPTSPFSRTFDGTNWSTETSAGEVIGADSSAFSSVAIDGNNNPIAAWSGIANTWTHSVIFRAGYSDNTWSNWFLEFGEGPFGPDWVNPSLTYYNTDMEYIAIVNHTSGGQVKQIVFTEDGSEPVITTLSTSGAWANITQEDLLSGAPIPGWTDQSSSPYEIKVGSSGGLSPMTNPYQQQRRAVVQSRTSDAMLMLEFEPMKIVTADGDTTELGYKPATLREQGISLVTMWDYLGTDVVTLPGNARWLDVSKQFITRGSSIGPRRFFLRVLNSSGIPLAVIDTSANSGTVRVDIAAYAGMNVMLRPQVVIVGINPSSVNVGVGDVFTVPSEQTRPTLVNKPGAANGNLPTEFGLSQNYPNPFNPQTIIQYQLPEDALVSLKVYDVLGRELATLVNEAKAAGYYRAVLDGARLSSGVYFYRIQAASFISTKKLLLMK